MATFSKVILSGSTDGRPVSVVQTATAGDLLHTADASAIDEVWLYALNRHTGDVVLTIELGGVTAGDLITVTLTADGGPVLIVPGTPMTNSLVVRAFADTTAVVSVFGWVNRIS
jgi:hypothetical protein